MRQTDINDRAHDYAKSTTNARCFSMGRCDGCKVRYCDYRSRVLAYMAGVHDARRGNDKDYGTERRCCADDVMQLLIKAGYPASSPLIPQDAALRWLREAHHITVTAEPYHLSDVYPLDGHWADWTADVWHVDERDYISVGTHDYSTWEDATDEGIATACRWLIDNPDHRGDD